MKLLTTVNTLSPKHLGKLLHSQASGSQRPHLSADRLVRAIEEGTIAVDEIFVPWRPVLDESLIDELLADEKVRRIESPAHRVLKVHARLLALAIDAQVMLEPEAAVTADRFPLRADLVAWSAFGLSCTFECGAVDGRSVLAQLEAGHVRVTVLPFTGMASSGIVALSFRHSANPPFPHISVAHALDSWEHLRLRADSATFQAACM
jgi:hypothetical protein